MRQFTFRLETLLKFRNMQKEQAQIQFAMATHQYQSESEKLFIMKKRLSQYRTHFSERQQHGITVETLKSFHDYFDKMKRDIDGQHQRVEQANNHRQECLQAFQEKAKNADVVAKLREKKLDQHRVKVLQEEQKVLDEIGLQIHVRQTEIG